MFLHARNRGIQWCDQNYEIISVLSVAMLSLIFQNVLITRGVQILISSKSLKYNLKLTTKSSKKLLHLNKTLWSKIASITQSLPLHTKYDG